MFFKSLISRVIILNILLLATGIGIFTLLHIRREQQHLLAATHDSAELLLTTIEKSVFNAMRNGNSEDVQAILEMVGRNHRLLNVRIFHPDGTVLKSAYPEEIGTQVNPADFALFRDNTREGMFRLPSGEVLSLVRPIISDDRCYLCHGQGRRVVGVININLSLDDTAAKLKESTEFSLMSMVVMILLLSGGISLVLLRFVKRPIQKMAARMAQVEAGDLSVRLEPRYGDEMGSLMGSFNSMVDNLEAAQKELERYHYRQMERADRLASVGEMATGVAHEIKNPLACISGAVSVLADDFDESDPRREIIGKVLEQIGRLDKTATDLLFFGRPGKPEFSFVDINALIKKTLFFVAQHPEAHSIHRIKELTRDLPPVWVDEKQMQQVLFNIIINAIQAMQDGGTLSIQTDLIDGGSPARVRVQIADTGRGISPADLEKIFVPFFTTKTQGTGLGLPICRQLLEQLGGTLTVTSQLGEGTTFTIELPVGNMPESHAEEA